ncbi:MAG: radical SAM protein, partial [Candidatus Daviesbacteria bacterium]|nr:radical SAM protein [Candidatus Daviesbacteria bacterium]
MLEGNKNNSCMGAYNTLDIKLTDKCNGNCAFCIEDGGRLSKEAKLNYLINKVNDVNPSSVLILGGEPTLYKELPEFLEGISGREIYMTTNGSRLNNSDLVKKISKNLTALN